MGLRSMVATEGCTIEVSQRLKRVPTILDKIRRYPTMRLASMQDIGGCRAVLSDVDEVRRVERRLRRNRPPLRVCDYITIPKDSGYRGIHVVVDYDGRAVEVQLRTQVMHQWAITVERLSGRLQEDLKSGRGPAEVLAYLSGATEAMAIEEGGGVVDQETLATLVELRKSAVPFLQGGGRP
jgi:putative GTP pyrophosphokinase